MDPYSDLEDAIKRIDLNQNAETQKWHIKRTELLVQLAQVRELKRVADNLETFQRKTQGF